MRLLVSVASAGEAEAALEGGAEIIDAKDPAAGALGPVTVGVLRDIHAAVAGRRALSAALGDALEEAAIEHDTHAFVSAGANFVKIGFPGIDSARRLATLAAAAIRGSTAARTSAPIERSQATAPELLQRPRNGSDSLADGGVILVGYVDVTPMTTSGPAALVDLAASAGAAGVLLDTAHKTGPGLRALAPVRALTAWVARAHEAGLIVALAGKLTAGDLPFVRDTGADIVGVRGAACEGGRTGRIATQKVRELRAMLEQ
jgi:uncharacterized protein (UPF0264 family)